MVPPWVPAVGDEPGGPAATAPQQPDQPQPPVQIAPPGRFRAARRDIGVFVSTGSVGALRRSLGHYVKSGYGGSGTAARRLGNTVSTARALHSVLSGLATGQADLAAIQSAVLAGASADEVLDAVVQAVRPVDGTQDADANRAAVRDSLTELLNQYPDADLLNLNEEQKTFATEQFVAFDVFQRLQLDLGKTIQDRAPSVVEALSRLREVLDYVRESVSASFRKLRIGGVRITATTVSSVVKAAIQDTVEVFEGYVR